MDDLGGRFQPYNSILVGKSNNFLKICIQKTPKLQKMGIYLRNNKFCVIINPKGCRERSQIPPSVSVEPLALLENEMPGEEKVGIAGEMGVSGSCEEVAEGICFCLDSQGALVCELLLPGMQWEFVAIKWGLRRAIQAL